MTTVQQIGGDFYDAFPLGDDEYCVAIGDVAGKGVPAALFMVRTITALRAELLKNQSLEVAISKLNQLICGNNPSPMFATLIVGILNRRAGSFRYLDAGHGAVILGGGVGFKQLPLRAGIPVGILDTAEYEVQSIDLKSGDVAFPYTDGVTEAVTQEHKIFTLESLMDGLLAEAATSTSELANWVRLSIAQHIDGAPLSDDLTMVIVRCC
ncbi:MAG: sigma-B regulation protein RsbU (phosphoserine phosphatase) [Hyphomicrobiaceae bacterium]|jgi:sigma-B regulation protein RsbU (phosphoserine phosphatase)